MIYFDKPVLNLPKVRIERVVDGDYMLWFVDTMEGNPIDIISIRRDDVDAKYITSDFPPNENFNTLLTSVVKKYYTGVQHEQ